MRTDEAQTRMEISVYPEDSSSVPRNLSYVLHERSTSRTVSATTSALIRRRKGIDRTVQRLAALDDAEFAARIVKDIASNDDANEVACAHVLSIMIGAFELLPRALQLAGLLHDGEESVYIFLDGSDCSNRALHTFFRAQALLCTPQHAPSSDSPWVFAAALIRPGDQSLLVRCVPVGVGVIDREQVWSVVLQHAEATIREFVLQWRCERPLWDRPVEENLPEFA